MIENAVKEFRVKMEHHLEGSKGSIPMERAAQQEEIAKLLYLARDASSF